MNPANPGRPWWQTLLMLFRFETETDAVESGALARSDKRAGSCQWHTTQDGADLRLIMSCNNGVNIASTLPRVVIPPIPFCCLIALLVLGSA